MGGQHSFRGYLVQSMNMIIDSFNDKDWISVTLEPSTESEKVDIKWIYANNKKKVCQVKSSINVFKYSDAQKWSGELENSVTDADSYELIMIGNPDTKLGNTPKIGKVNIPAFKPMNIDSLIDETSTKIDKFYENHGKPKVNASVREILVKVLIQEMNFNAIAGAEVSRTEFEQKLLGWFVDIEKQILINPWSEFAPVSSSFQKPIEKRIIDNIFELIGWNNFNQDEKITEFDEHIGKEIEYNLNYRGECESGLIGNTDDFIVVQAEHCISYGERAKEVVNDSVNNANLFVEKFKDEQKIPVKRNEKTNIFSILFYLSSSNDDLNKDYIYEIKDYFNKSDLKDDISYFVVDNAKATFLISSIISAKNYRPELPVKFLYPITDLNTSPEKIGKRGLQLPPQYINSSIIPIVKESAEQISVLLYCSDPYNTEYLKKLIWLAISLTSGYANEYRIYFPDYEEGYSNEVKETVRSFNDTELNQKLKVAKYEKVDSVAISNIRSASQVVSNQKYNDSNIVEKDNSKILNKAFIEILPYGDILKPFLRTDAILANDLKIFLSKKGIYVKNADKKKLIVSMTPLLFSPAELEDFKSMIDVKERPTKTSQEIYKLTSDIKIEEVVKNFSGLDKDILCKDTETKILGTLKFVKSTDNPVEYTLEVKTEKKDPTNHLSVNTTYGKLEISCKIENGNLFVNSIKTITHDDKVIASRILSENRKKLIDKSIIQNETIELLFSKFSDNKERVDFLLSFTNIASSSVFNEAEIRNMKYKYDKSMEIPEGLKDRTERDIVTYLNGRDLGGLNEMSNEELRKILLLDEVAITYKFNWRDVKNGLYTVKYNFSNALYNKKGVEGTFRSEATLIMTQQVKKLSNIDNLKRELLREVEKLKLEKLKEYSII